MKKVQLTSKLKTHISGACIVVQQGEVPFALPASHVGVIIQVSAVLLLNQLPANLTGKTVEKMVQEL